MPGRREIIRVYQESVMDDIANDRRPMAPAEFMLESSPGKNKVKYKGRIYPTSYGENIPDSDPNKNSKSIDSARRAYSKLLAGQNSGKKIYERSQLYTYGSDETGMTVAQPRGGYMQGMWKVNVIFRYYDEDGEEHGPVIRSFIVRDKKLQYTSQFDRSALRNQLLNTGEIDNRMALWGEGGSPPMSEYEIDDIQVYRIQTTSKTSNFFVEL